jgi:hypothetical protein
MNNYTGFCRILQYLWGIMGNYGGNYYNSLYFEGMALGAWGWPLQLYLGRKWDAVIF